MKRFRVAILAGAVFGACAAGAFGPIVRHEVARASERYGATTTVGQVVPTWSGILLRDVDVRLAEVPCATIHLGEVEIKLVGDRTASLHGGSLVALGSIATIASELEAWRARRTGGSTPSGPHDGARDVAAPTITGLDIDWRDDARSPSMSLVARGLAISGTAGRLTFVAASTDVLGGPARVHVAGATLSLTASSGSYKIESVAADAMEAEISLPAGAPPGSSAEPTARSAGAVRDRLLAYTVLVDALLADGATVEIQGVHAALRDGGDTLNLGPGVLSATRESRRLKVELRPVSPPSNPGATAREPSPGGLTFTLSVPIITTLGAESQPEGGEIIADIRGGPIGLAALGVHEGDFGLLDVSGTSLETQSRVVLSTDGRSLTLDGAGKIHHLSLKSDALSDEPVVGLELAFRGKGEARVDGSVVRIDDGEIDLGAIQVHARGLYEKHAEKFRLSADVDLPLTGCEAMLDSVPAGLARKLQGIRLAGSYALRGKARIDTASLDRDFVLDWDSSNTCRVVDAPPLVDVSRFQRTFRRWVQSPEGAAVEIDAGPGAPGWVPLAAVSPFMAVAVQTTEDAAFYRHRGFDPLAIKNSIRENLRRGQFYRGASTISMQVAKNLYLDRKKNLSRKLQEAVLTMYLEQALTKDQIMELYLNLVEFGPMVYGVSPAASHYFSAPAGKLSLGQALYLSSIMPSPKVQHFGAGGLVTPGWTRYLRRLMKNAHERGRIDDQQLEEGLRETVVLGSPTPLREPSSDAELPAGRDADVLDTPPDVEDPDGR